MFGRAAGAMSMQTWLRRAVLSLDAVLLLACCLLAAGDAHQDRLSALSLILGIAAVVAGLMVAGAPGAPSVSASFLVILLAAAFLGPASACLAAILSELAAAARLRTEPRVIFLINLPVTLIPGVGVAFLMP